MTSIQILCLIVALFVIDNNVQAAPPVSHEDIRDAILSVVSIFRENTDKLERHEYRERQLGEQLKKALSVLDKRYKAQDHNVEKLGALMLRFDEKMKNFDTAMKLRDEREKIQLLKSQDTIEDVQMSISKIMEELQALATNNSKLLDIQDSNTAYLEALKTTMFNKFDALSAKIDRLQADVTDSKQNTVSKTAEIDDDIKESIRETEKILKKIDKKNEEPPKDSKWQLELSSAINRQQETLNDLLEVATNTSKNLSFFSTKTDLEELTNETHENFQAMKKEIMEKNDQVVNNLSTKINEGVLIIGHGQEEINQTLVDLIRKEDNLHSGVSKSYEQLLKEIKSLSETERVIIQTADNILDIKRRIEYGVQQILLEIGGLIKLESKNLNGTINSRFDTVEETFLENQTTALANLSLKIETEISQVWRQIGIMYQKLTMSVDTLDKLQQQTDTYVNGSTRAMDSIDGKVGTITNRMTEVEDNLNYLLGKLSLVTSEFNQIKSGLASALDNIRSDFMDVHNEIKDSEPGPKQVSNDLRI